MEAASLPPAAGPATARPGRLLLRLRTDDQLVALFRLGNDEAFRVIHDRYRARLLAYTRQMLGGSAADAEDALQDVYLRAYGALRADGRPVTLRAWLYRVAHNRCIDHLRRPANQPTGELRESLRSPQDPAADVQQREDLRRLVADVARLPEHQRSALLMRELEGLSYAELADALGTTIPSVKSLLVRARMGLTEAREARDACCEQIRADLAAAHGRGVRLSGLARRHVRECPGCAEYRGGLRRLRSGLAALGGAPTGWAGVAKLLGLGGAGSGAMAGAGGGVAGGGGVVAGGTLAAGGTAKVAALVCCAAVVGGGAVEASKELGARDGRRATPRAAAPERAPAPAPAGVVAATPVVAVTPRPAAAPDRPRPGQASRPASPAPVAEEELPPEPLPAPAPPVSTEPATLGGSSADEDAQQAAAAGGMLAPEPAADPEPLVPVDEVVPAPPAEDEPAEDVPPAAPPTGTTGP